MFYINVRVIARLVPVLLFLVTCVPVAAQPAINGVSGSVAHGGTLTIQGSGFGTKTTAAPVVWDDASGTNVLDKWDGAWPTSQFPAYALTYRAPMRGVAPPHNRVGKYLAGAHGSTGATGGQNVMVWKNRTLSTPGYTYASWYQRSDPAWVFGDDNNFKLFDWSTGTEPYGSQYCYIEHNPRFTSLTSTGAWAGSCNGWGQEATNLFNQWVKIEVEIKWTSQSDGYMKVWDNGRLVVDVKQATDSYSGTARNDAIGGFARMQNQPNNWRYFADLYLDHSRARVILGNASTLATSTRREVQIPSQWSNSSLAVTVNRGALTDGQTAYLYVVDPNGTVNALGFPVVLSGGTVNITAPAPPTSVRILR